jgi:GLPGLI family protein
MKKIYLLCFLILTMSAIEAQLKEGSIVYERKIDLHRRIQDEQMRSMIPQFRTSKHMLLFSDSTSIYKTVPEDEAPDPFEGGAGGPRVMMRFGGGDGGELYKNFATGVSSELNELGAKTYIIDDSIKTQKWKLTAETKKVLGHNCFKATAKQTVMIANAGPIRIVAMGGDNPPPPPDSTKKTPPQLKQQENEIVAWFAEDIISPVGPENNGGLPGVILELNINNGETVYTAIEIKNTVNKKDIKQPAKGKKVTRDEYRKLVQEMMMNQGPPPGGMRRM